MPKNKKCVSSSKMLSSVSQALKALDRSQKHAEKLVKREKKAIAKLLELEALIEDAETCKCKKPKKSAKKVKKKNAKKKSQKRATSSSAQISQLALVPEAASESVAAEPDDLAMISGVGPGLATKLNELGVTQFSQIAAWTQVDIDRMDLHLTFPGRIVRENWVEQAKALAEGGRDEYVRVFGKEPR